MDSIYDFVMDHLKGLNGDQLEKVAAGSGVPLSTVKKIRLKQILDPGVSHIEKLARFFRRRRKPHEGRAIHDGA